MVLLHILDGQIQRQTSRRGQAAYELYILMVDTSLESGESLAERFNDISQTFPCHTFSLVSLSEVFELDSSIFEDLSDLGARKLETPEACLSGLLSYTTTSSSRQDVLQLLLTRLIVGVAKLNICDGILWGHSSSRLAAKALSNVAKGRGGDLPFEITDGTSSWGVSFYHPLRDLFKSELVNFANEVADPALKLVVHDLAPAAAPSSVRGTSIDDLLSNYINTQGEKYPSIMANVVRTAGKLQTTSFAPTETVSRCSICAMPELAANGETLDPSICFACQRLKLETRLTS